MPNSESVSLWVDYPPPNAFFGPLLSGELTVIVLKSTVPVGTAERVRDELRKLTTQRYYNRSMAFDAELEKKVQDLTPVQVVEALRRHLKVEEMSIFKAGDFKNVTF